MSQPDVTALARRYAIDVNLGTDAAPDWQRLIGVREFSPNNEPVHEDDQTYDDEGWGRDARTGIRWLADVTLSHKKGPNGEWNPVHRHLRNSSTKYGAESEVGIRYYDREGAADDAWQGKALVDWTPEGGEPTNPDRVEVNLLGQGPLVPIDNPAGDPQDPQVTSINPEVGPEAGGTLVHIHGLWFDDVQDVEFGGSSADDYTVVTPNLIVAVAPSGSGEQEVVVTTAVGTSSDGPNFTYEA